MTTTSNHPQELTQQPVESVSMKPAKNKGGAPIGNTSRTRHGLTAGQLPVGCSWIASLASQFRTALETAVLDAKGEVGILDAAAISTAVRWERHALLAQRWLRVEFAKLDLPARLAYSREVAQASANRDKAIERLGIEQTAGDIWAQIDSSALPQHELAPDLSHLASPPASADANPPVESVDGVNARDVAELEATNDVAGMGDTQAEFTREDRSH